MKLPLKIASAVGAAGIAATGGLAVIGSTGAASAPAIVKLARVSQAVPAQVAPTPAPADPAAAEATTEPAESAGEPAGEAQLPGGGHADAPGTVADHQFDGIE